MDRRKPVRINRNLRFVSKIEYVDKETGEQLTKQRYVKENYTVVKKTKKIVWGITENTIVWQWECEHNRQTRIGF